MSLFATKPRTITSLIDLAPGYFAKVGSFYLLPTVPLKNKTVVQMSTLPGSCMFQMYQGLVDGALVGYVFSSAFQVINGGGYLLTKMGNLKPTDHTVLLRTPDLVIYSYSNVGALAVSLKVSSSVAQILETQ